MISRGICLFIIASMVSFWAPGCLLADEPNKQKKMDEVSREMAKVRNQEIVFFGKVVDFEGAPVVDAKVKMRVRVFGVKAPQKAFNELNSITDDDGSFSVTGFGEMITLDTISRDGYVYHYKYNRKRSRQSAKREQRKGPGFEPDKPMIFKMRKKAPPSFVLIGNWEFGLRAGDAKLLDMYRREWASPDRLAGKKLNYPDWQADIKTSVEESGDGYRLIVEALENDSGFVVETPEFFEEMTEAPAQGYRPKLIIPIAKDSAGQLFAYVKNEGGLFYSKIYINYVNRVDRDHIEMRCGYWTNVTGERGLEFLPELASQYRRDAKAQRRSRVKREQLTSGGVVAPVIGVEQ